MLRLTAERAGIADGQRILELGCGWGSFSLWAGRALPGVAHRRGVELGEPAGLHPGARPQRRGLDNVEILTADMNRFEAPGTLRPGGLGGDVRAHAQLAASSSGASTAGSNPGGTLFVHVFAHARFAYPFEIDGRRRLDGAPLLHRRHDAVRRPAAARAARPLDARGGTGVVSGTHYARTAEAWHEHLVANGEAAVARAHRPISAGRGAACSVPPVADVLPGLRRALRLRRRARVARLALPLWPTDGGTRVKIAVVGSGDLRPGRRRTCSRAGTTWCCSRPTPRVGGHTHTVDVPEDGRLGPGRHRLHRLQRRAPTRTSSRCSRQLGVAWQESDMSFSVRSDRRDFEYGSAGAERALRPAPEPGRPALPPDAGATSSASTGRRSELLDEGPEVPLRRLAARPAATRRRSSRTTCSRSSGAVWSSNREGARDFPARFLVRFFDNHGFLRGEDGARPGSPSRAARASTSGPSWAAFGGEVRTGSPVERITPRRTA